MSEPTEAVETVEQTAEFKGEMFKLNPEISEWAVLEFAAAADEGEDGETMRGMASLRNFVLELVHEDDRGRFRAVCRRERVKVDDLLEFLFGKKIEDATERPTERSSDSSDGPTITEPKSVSNSDDKDSPRTGLEMVRQRPDLAMFLDMAAS